MAEGNKNQWVIWTIVIGAIVVTLIAFNYQGDKKEVIPLSDIFPEEFDDSGTIEYEFVEEDKKAEEVKTVAKVKPVAPKVKQSAAQPHGVYAIQALSSKNKEMTEKEIAKLKKKGLPAYLVTMDLENKGVWYRIYVGKFAEKKQAENYLPTVKQIYGDCFIRFLK